MRFNIRSLNPATTQPGALNALVRIDFADDYSISASEVKTNARNDLFFKIKIDDTDNMITIFNPTPKKVLYQRKGGKIIVPKGKFIAMLAIMPATALGTLNWTEVPVQAGETMIVNETLDRKIAEKSEKFLGVTATSEVKHFEKFTHNGFTYDQHSVRIFHYAMQNDLYNAFGRTKRIGGAAVRRGTRIHAGFDTSRGSKKLIAWKPLECSATYWDHKGGGNTINVTDGEFTFTVMHLVKQEKAKSVKKDDYIASMGTTGRSSGDHWHIKVSYGKHNMPNSNETYTMANGLQAYFAYSAAVAYPNEKVLWGGEGSQSRTAARMFLEKMGIEVPSNF